MNRTRIIFFAIIILALAVVGVSLATRQFQSAGAIPQPKAPDVVTVRVVTALPIEPWVQDAARAFNAQGVKIENSRINVSIIPMDGLTAMGKFERGEFETTPTAWIPDSRYLVELSNATFKEKLGRDVFLTDGEYRARPIAISLFSWGIYQSRADVLRRKFNTIDWKIIHDAAIAKGGWPELGGKPEWGYFKLVVPNPRKNVGGLQAMVAAAGEYYGKTDITVADVTNPQFQQWLKELMGAVTDFSSLGSYTAENIALFGYSTGDGGQLLESDLLVNNQGIQTRWGEPLQIVYPTYLTWFDFPFTIWVGSETTALEKNAALEFERYLLRPEVQAQAISRGLRPANSDVPIPGDSLFAKWQPQGAVAVVPRTTAMRSPSREVLRAFLDFYRTNFELR